MSALDKLNAKASIEKLEVKKETPKKTTVKKMSEKKPVQKKMSEPVKKVAEKTKAAPKKEQVEEKPFMKEVKVAHKPEKHAGGRKNIRGENGKDFKMVNIAVPIDVYDRIKEASRGNMTYYINDILRKSVNA